MTPQARRRRKDQASRWVWAFIDAVVWILAVYSAILLRYDFTFQPLLLPHLAAVAVAVPLCHVLVGALVGPYAVGHSRGSFEEIVDVGRTASITAAALVVWTVAETPDFLPRSVPVMAAALAVTAMFALRFIVRSWRTRRAMARDRERRVILFGAGEAGRRLLRSMVRDHDHDFTPVALLDDDKAKGRLRVEGVRVRGTRTAMTKVAEKLNATDLVIALPNAEAGLIRDLTERAEAAGLNVLLLPPLREIIGPRPRPADLRSVDLEDLLGRRPITLDTTQIAEQIAGRVVLVTGAGGSIGSELCRQIARFGPARLLMLDRDESALQAAQLSLTGRGLLDSDDIVLADIRDLGTLRTVFEDTKPDIVFHAAALKHLPLLEQYPLEAWKTNVLGTLNVLRAASEVGVGTFVNISTDKAANPTCVLGYSKRVTERLTADFARRFNGSFVSVRFGNVLGSRGSVVHAFTAQIEQGGPVTVTHPDVERFFMLIPEACQLVLEAASIGTDGEVMVLDMGEQVKIVTVAETLIRMSDRHDIDIVFTGLRPGEKLGEELFSDAEERRATSHPLVNSVAVPPLEREQVEEAFVVSHETASGWMYRESFGDLVDVAQGGSA